MPKKATPKLELQCHANCDDVFLTWQVAGSKTNSIDGCSGYAIETRTPDGKIQPLVNLKGFEADKPTVGERRPSTEWPLQTFTWTDHTILVGSKVQFRVTAMMGTPGKLTPGATSGWSPVQELVPAAGVKTSAFFNRGFILSQFVQRFAAQNKITTMPALKAALTKQVDGHLMQFLTGELGKAIRGLLAEAKSNPKMELNLAMFELDLPDLIDGLIALGKRAHVLLANGAVSKAGGDENSAAAKRLKGKVDLHRRMCAPKGLGHNKFCVVSVDGKPTRVWTGSTNWSMTGLHTQANNGIFIDDAGIAEAYLAHWKELVGAKDAFPPTLKKSCSTVRGPMSLAKTESVRVWFTPLTAPKKQNGADINDLLGLVKAAKEGILFVMFMPGQEPLNSILKRQEDGLYVRGIVSTLPLGNKNKKSGTFQIMNGKDFKKYSLDVVQPSGQAAVGDFLATFTRQQFLNGMGFAITHSKILVIDPFGKAPVVVTGSHNMSSSASTKNDENLVIIEGSPELARAYAVNCMAVHDHYRWAAYQQEVAKARGAKKASGKTASSHDRGFLDPTDSWQKIADDPDRQADAKFWIAGG
jgi:phosphatidylserine/phosphatidylglycerophosphate/cardiolipin synthase-like enzyme